MFSCFLQNIWDNLKRATKKKLDESQRTGAGGSELSKLDKIVADVLGVDGPHMTGLGLNDDDPVLPGTSAATENQSQALDFSNLDMSFTSTAGKLPK